MRRSGRHDLSEKRGAYLSSSELLVRIARCAGDNTPSPRFPGCTDVVATQNAHGPGIFQVPEPWRGDLAKAPLLFVGSNPAFDPTDGCPTAAWSDQKIADYYTQGFSRHFPKIERTDRQGVKNVPFWSAVRKRAYEIYGPTAVSLQAGVDFALTEVVHCKSRSEGVAKKAARDCCSLHFPAIAEYSGARVVVILGKVAADVLHIPRNTALVRGIWYGKQRIVMWLPHPNARVTRTVAALYTPSDIEELNEALPTNRPCQVAGSASTAPRPPAARR